MHQTANQGQLHRKRKWQKTLAKLRHDKVCYLFLLLPLIYMIIFNYAPMYGIQIAFRDFKGYLGITGSKWVGLKHFINFLNNPNFWRYMTNTVSIAVYTFVAGFFPPIILALLLTEVNNKFSKVARTIFYAPHFISTVVMVGMILIWFSPSIGVVNNVIALLGGERYYFMGDAGAFRHMYVWSGVWQGMGWSSVLYLAALSAVSPELHEAAMIDGASRFQRIIHINLPTLYPIITISLIMGMGNLVSVGYDKIYLMQNPLNQSVSEVISTFTYKQGILGPNQSSSAAVGLFNTMINLVLLLVTNGIARKFSENSLF